MGRGINTDTLGRAGLLIGGSVIAIMAAGAAAIAQEPVPQTAAPGTPTPGTATPAAPAAATPGGTTPGTATPGATTQMPQITVTAPKTSPKRATAQKPAAPPSTAPVQTAEQVQVEANRQVVTQTQNLDQRRDSVIMPKIGANTYELSQKDIGNIPQANAIQLSDLVLQFPGVAQDSTDQGDFHIRNEHGNVQYRINGILLPDGVSGFSQILESSFIGSMRLITGALPAQYGLHTSGIIDITTKSGSALAGGSVGLYGGSRQTISPSFEYGGVTGQTEYFATGRYLSGGLGLEIPTPTLNGIHDYTQQGRFFSYTSTLLDRSTRFVTIAGVGESQYQIPNNVGQGLNAGGFNGPNGGPFTAWGASDFNSINVNERQYEKNAYGVAAWQRSVDNVDVQLAYYSRYSDLHFVPDPVGDMLFNNVSSDVYRSTFLNGISGDGAYRINDAHTLRAGFYAQGEQTQTKTMQTVEAVGADGVTATEPPYNIYDGSNLFGWQLGAYLQDEWRLTETLTLNYGLRFDQIYQYVDANQLSPRASLTYKPWWSTVLHAGYMRTFTPPPQVLGRLTPVQIYDNTTSAAAAPNVGSIEPERSHVFDAGMVQQLLPQCPKATGGLLTKAPIAATNCPSLEVGADAYYSRATDLLDDGQFGQAYTLTAFNYAKAEKYGLELTARFRQGNFTADTSWAFARQHANTVASNQSLFGPDELAYIATNWINTDHEQYITGSTRLAYRWNGFNNWWDGTVMSGTMIYGSGLRSGFANTDHGAPYGQVNLGVSHEFAPSPQWGLTGQPITVRFDVVNVFDTIYSIRDGSGIGVFASQYGPRRGYYMGISQKLGDGTEPGVMARKAPPAPINSNWAGSYVGANFGGAFDRQDVTSPLGISSTDPSGVLGGFQFGYNFQFAAWLLGVEAELDGTSAQGGTNFSNAVAALSITSDQNWYGTLDGRLGYVIGPMLLYAKGGGAWMNASYRVVVNSGLDGSASTTSDRTGWNVGAGLEYMLTPRWSAKFEYDYLDFGTNTLSFGVPFGTGLTFKTEVNEVKAGANYHWAPGTLFGVF